jgi:hypothetical protein
MKSDPVPGRPRNAWINQQHEENIMASIDATGQPASAPRLYTLDPDTCVVFTLPFDLKVFTLHQVSQACDQAEAKLGNVPLSIIPPVEGCEQFELHAEQEVTIDFHVVKQALFEALEAMI